MTSPLAIIPARIGSKRIPEKNIRLLDGVPILARTISHLISAAVFDRILVSTDSPKIRDVAQEAGAEVPFLRPAELADDHAGIGEVLRHALECFEELPVAFACVFPSAVLLGPDRICAAWEQFITTGSPSTISVLEYPHPIARALKIGQTGLSAVSPSEFMRRTQDLHPCYHDAGQFYFANTEQFMKQGRFLMEGASAFLLDRCEAIDVDTPDDWDFLELLWRSTPNNPRAS